MVRQFSQVDRALRAEGFQSRAPSAEVAAQDEGTCRRLVCARCSRPGLTYRPYVLPGPRPDAARYRALAVCLRCQVAMEF